MNAIKNMAMEDMPETFRQIAEIIGKRNCRKLMLEFAGATIYFPSKLPTETISKYIQANFTGDNVPELARELGISRTSVYSHLQRPVKPC